MNYDVCACYFLLTPGCRMAAWIMHYVGMMIRGLEQVPFVDYYWNMAAHFLVLQSFRNDGRVLLLKGYQQKFCWRRFVFLCFGASGSVLA